MTGSIGLISGGNPVTYLIHGNPVPSVIQMDSPHPKQIDNYPDYPNSRVVFSPKGNWDNIWKGSLWNDWNSACRMIEFKSTKPLSALDHFVLMGHRNGKVSLSLHFPTDMLYHGNVFEKYFTAQGFTCYADGFTHPGQKQCDAKTHEELKTLFKIISTHNEIPEPYLQKLQEIVEKGHCDITPPLVPLFKQVKYIDTSKIILAPYEVADESQSRGFINSFLKNHMYMYEENVDVIMNGEGRSIKEFYNQYEQTIKIIKYTVRLSPSWKYTQIIDHYLLAFCHRKLVQLGTLKDEDAMVETLTRTRFANIRF